MSLLFKDYFYCTAIVHPQALLKRTAKLSGEDRTASPVPAEDTSLFAEPLGRRKRKQGRRRGQGAGQGGEKKKTKKIFREFVRRSSFPSLPVLKIVQQIGVRVCVYLYTCVYVCLRVCVCMCVCVCVCVCVGVRVYMCVCKCVCVHVSVKVVMWGNTLSLSFYRSTSLNFVTIW